MSPLQNQTPQITKNQNIDKVMISKTIPASN